MTQEIQDFQILSMGASDHLPVKLTLKTPNPQAQKEKPMNRKLMEKFKWNPETLTDYHRALQQTRFPPADTATVEEMNERIKQAIKNSARQTALSIQVNVNQENPTINKPWFNDECRTLRKKTNALHRRF